MRRLFFWIWVRFQSDPFGLKLFLSVRCDGYFSKIECVLLYSNFFWVCYSTLGAITNLHSICDGPHPGAERTWLSFWSLVAIFQFFFRKSATTFLKNNESFLINWNMIFFEKKSPKKEGKRDLLFFFGWLVNFFVRSSSSLSILIISFTGCRMSLSRMVFKYEASPPCSTNWIYSAWVFAVVCA